MQKMNLTSNFGLLSDFLNLNLHFTEQDTETKAHDGVTSVPSYGLSTINTVPYETSGM